MRDQNTRAAVASAGGRVAWQAHTIAGEMVCDAGEYLMRHKRTGGTPAPRKAARVFRAVLPTWMLPVFTACLVIPGPFDEGAAGIVALVMLAVRFRRARSAWRGGKSSRAAQARKAGAR